MRPVCAGVGGAATTSTATVLGKPAGSGLGCCANRARQGSTHPRHARGGDRRQRHRAVGGTAMSSRVRLRFRLRDRLRFRQRGRLRFPARCAWLAGFPCTRAGFGGDCAADISVSAGKCSVSRLLTGDPVVLCLAARSPLAAWRDASCPVLCGWSLLVTWAGTVGPACRVVASRRRCFAALARLLVPAAALRCVAGRCRTVQPSLSRRLPARAARRAGGAL